MGCDIHMYVEYKRKNDSDKQFRNFGGRINPGRNYYMFGLLAKGVRSDNEAGFETKGLPDKDSLGWRTSDDAFIRINDKYAEEDDNYCTLEDARKWAKYGRKIYNYNDEPTWVDHPDWHSHTWLTSLEYSSVIDKYNTHPEAAKYKEAEYEAVLAVLNSLENNGMETRVVFWFDN